LKQAGVLREAPTVVMTSARDGTGIDELVAAIDAHRASGLASGALVQRRREGAIARGVRGFVRRHGELGVERAGGLLAVERAMELALGSSEDVASAVTSLEKLGDPRTRGRP
jgi:putative protein kinase ArgK-like GTPase of G3E family